jgi:hypothetical protein
LVPVAVTEKEVALPEQTVELDGWLLIDGAELTVKVTVVLVKPAVHEPLTKHRY